MENEEKESVGNPNPPQPQPMRRKSFINKKLIAIVVIVVLLIAGVLLFLLTGNQSEQNKSSDSETPKTLTQEEILQLSNATAEYIESQRNPDGSYLTFAHQDENCEIANGVEECPFGNTKTSFGLNTWTSLANYSTYKATGNELYLNRLDRDIQQLFDYCQPNLDECLWLLVQLEIIYEDTKNDDILSFLEEILPLIVTKAPADNAMLAAIEARQLILAYKITGQDSYLKLAKERLGLANNLLTLERNIFPPNAGNFFYNTCWVTLTTAEIAGIEDNPQSLANVSYYLEKSKLKENFNRFENPIAIQPCIESYLLLYSYTNEESYKILARDLLGLFIDNFVDSPKNNFAYGEGGTTFFRKDALNHLKDKRYVTVTDSAYTNYLLYLSKE